MLFCYTQNRRKIKFLVSCILYFVSVIIYINFVELESLMLYNAKFQDHMTSGSEEEDF